MDNPTGDISIGFPMALNLVQQPCQAILEVTQFEESHACAAIHLNLGCPPGGFGDLTRWAMAITQATFPKDHGNH